MLPIRSACLSVRGFIRLGAACVVGVLALAPASAQAPLPSRDVEVRLDSGWVQNRSKTSARILSLAAGVEDASWVRLYFDEISLPEHGAKLVITSVLDGARQVMTAEHCRQWRNSSCYLNGDDVQIEIEADPGSGRCRVVLAKITAGLPPDQNLSQCGPTDDRLPSADPRAARLLPVGCSAWLIDDCGHCFLTAGHCAPAGDTAQFNVPLSTPGGGTVNPPPEDQYAVDASSVKTGAPVVIGEDWAYFGCLPNTNTGLRPFQRQGIAYVLAAAAPSSPAGVTIRITGYGTDSSSRNQTQQTHSGPYVSLTGTTVRYSVDTEGGNSGSAVAWEEEGVAIGIHTHGGCSSGGGSNAGTAIQNSALQVALATPIGTCICVGEASTYCEGKTNSQGCLELIGFSGIPSVIAGPGTFSITATNILNRRLGLLFYSYARDDTPYFGGTRCIAAPLKRTPPQNSGGSPSGTDCTGTFSFDMSARIAAGTDPALVVGETAYAQYFSRDNASPSGPLGLTNAVQFTIGP